MKFGHKKDEPAPPDPVFDEDEDLSEVWPQVVRQYEDTTKRKLDANTTFNSFQLQIDADIKESSTKSHQNARIVLNNIGNCLEQFGCMVAQVAGVVFGPAAQCWNAISFVVQAARSISGMMDGFVILMERSSAFIRRLVNFMEQKVGEGGSHLPRVLRRPAYNILSQFLGVLRCSYKLATSKKERWNKWAGIVLFNSDDMAESLELMEDQIQEFTRAEEKNLEKIAKHLGLKKSEDWETWSKRHNELCKTHVQGTGDWLSQDESAFVQWSDLNRHDRKVLFLRADSGFGKTHLFNHVVSHLEKKFRATRGITTAFLAYYYYGDDEDDSLERCVGSIIYQFASADIGYAKAVVDECARHANIARAEDRWNKLVWGLQHAMKGTYFICMDGFDSPSQLDSAEIMMSTIAGQAASSAKSNGVSLRLFVSGNDDALAEVSQGMKDVDNIFLGIRRDSAKFTGRASNNSDLASDSLPNASDLKAVTSARIEEVCKVKPGLKTILTDANIELLLKGIHGNYSNLEAKITEINACDTKGKVQEVINNTSADMHAVQRDRVKTLDAVLNSRQAQVLNDLLVWVAGCSYPPTIRLLESVLFFTSGEEFLLTDQIATTYSPVLMIDEGKVGFKGGVRDILSASASSGVGSAVPQLHSEAITSAEVELCRRFIRNACGAMDYDRFRFDDFFQAMAQKVNIHLEDDNVVNVTIIRLCIDVLFDNRKDANLEAIRDYASLWFYAHLKTLVEALDDFEPERKFMSDIGGKLVDLIYDPKMIDTWFTRNNLIWFKYDWLYSEEFLDPIVALLKNSQVAKGYAKDAKKSDWTKSVVFDTASKYSVLERIAARLATHWFSCSTGTIDRDYLWISWGIVAKISKPDKPFEERNLPPNAAIEEYICWVKEHKDIDIDSSTWDYRVGATYMVFEHYKEAIVALERVKQQSLTSWGLFFNLAIAHENQKNHRTALGYIQNFKSLSEMFLETDDSYKGAYWDMLKSEGNCYRECHEYDMAVQSYQEILSQNFSEASGMSSLHLDALLGLFKTWTDAKSSRFIIDLIRSWKDATAKGRGSTYWLRRASREDALHTCIIVAAKQVGAAEEIIYLYQEAIDHKPLDEPAVEGEPGMDISAEATAQLQYFQAVLISYGRGSNNDHHQSIKCWEDIVLQSDNNPASYMTAWNATRKLASSLLEKAFAETLPALSSSSEDYIGRLKNLANSNTRIICYLRQGSCDPSICLARLYYVKEDHTSASTQAQARLCSVFDKWPESTDDASLRMRFSSLAATLTVLDKDADAIAAWQAIGPYQPSNAMVAKADAPGTEELTQSTPEGPYTDSVPAENDKKSEDIPAAASSSTTTTKAYVSGYLCDGSCGVEWTDVMADCWACKHCLCVQLCPGCYKKLLDDDLQPLICNKDHKMLYIPPFDWEAWRTIPADMMTVDNKPVHRKDWVDKIRKEYNVQQDEIDFIKIEKARGLKAASVIAVRWRNRLQRAKTFREVAGAIVTSSVMKQHHPE
ncbi:uncharacterized protein J4E92_009688 [Alternaria infectoria]|uniref:uncharacterized protein n=1 Tax=Alternaria infectoria TaxID=45303 RepID=UPI00221EF1AD|nr:uncharacterized protein J4E92_009688 [Alternaria infectoria]KAI4914274.1 hypothetical protein J4E92_009688 [Alternaria infectoria]